MHPILLRFKHGKSIKKLAFPFPGLRGTLLILLFLANLSISEKLTGATWTQDGGSVNVILNAANESVDVMASQITISENTVDGYIVTLTSGSWAAGTEDPGIYFDGSALYIEAGRSLQIRNSAGIAGIYVTFKDSGYQSYLDLVSVTLDSNAGSVFFEGSSDFAIIGNSTDGLSVITDGPIVMVADCKVTSNSFIMLHSVLHSAVQTEAAFKMEGGALIRGTSMAHIEILGDSRQVATDTRPTMGVSINGASIIGSSTSGANGYVSVTGFGGGATTLAPIGVYIYGPPASGKNITSTGGDVLVTGTGGAGTASGNYGVLLDGGARISSGSSGKVTVDGTGGGLNSTKNIGVCLLTNSIIDSGGAGVVTITGKGGNTTGTTKGQNAGISVDHSTITSGGGNVVINGTGGGGIDNTAGYNGADNRGVYVLNLGVIKAGGIGSVSVTGKGGNNTTGGTFGYNYGVYVNNSGSLITSEGGNVSVSGTGGGDNGTSPDNFGIYVYSGGAISSGSTGSVTLTGTGGNSGGDTNTGIKVYSSSATVTSGGGNVSVTGYGGGAGESSYNYGIELNTGIITSGSNGSVTLNGTSGASSGENNHGVYLIGAGTVSSGGGNVSITGTSHPDASGWGCIGVKAANSSTITAGGSASVTILGAGGGKNNSGVQYNEGVDLTGTITSNGGPISVTGIEGSGADAYAIALWPGSITTSSKGGNITLRGNSMVYYGNSVIAVHASNTLSIVQYTLSTAIDLGPETDAIGGPVSIGSSEFACISGGTISIGDASSGAISLKTDIGGIVATTDYTQVNIAGSYSLSGVSLSLSGTYTPANGDVFTILTATALSGTFSGMANGSTTTFNGKTLTVNYTSTAVTLTASSGVTPPVTWDGSESTSWNTAANWSSNALPSATDNIVIPNVTNDPVVDITTAVCTNLTIESGGLLTVAAGKALTVSGTLTNNSTGGVVIQSDATGTGSLIMGAAAGTGSATAWRYMTTDAWHLVSTPLSGQTISDFLTANANIPEKSGVRGMMNYNPAANQWNGFFTGASGGSLTMGTGFAVRTSTDDAVKFDGTLRAGHQTLTALASGKWNCVGNPYTSALAMNENTGMTFNFLKDNVTSNANIDPLFGAIYIWEKGDSQNDLEDQYSIINNASPAHHVQQGQAFLVKMNSGATSVVFLDEMQVHDPTLALKSTDNSWERIKLHAKSGNRSGFTQIAFNSAMTRSLDPTYDAGLLKGSTNLTVYTSLVDDNGFPFAIQALPNNGFDTMVIPVGLDYIAGGEVTFSAEMQNLSPDCQPILEDRLTHTFTDLAIHIYTVTIPANSLITDRFQLHLSKLSTGMNNEISGNELKVFAVKNTGIRIMGMITGNTLATLYDIQGRVIVQRRLVYSDDNIVPTPDLSQGIYLLSLTGGTRPQQFKIQLSE